ncbi:MAG: helix-turn-helix domain-containing protein [Planctomycetes bacterium]|nr:helix-turn-helix domain-containing protein [Planctomycetota bacterium]
MAQRQAKKRRSRAGARSGGGSERAARPRGPVDPSFARLFAEHIRRRPVTKAALARAIGTRPQYIREVETGRKPPPTLDKVEILAGALGLTAPEREEFLACARQGRARPEFRDYLRNMEEAFGRLMEIFAVGRDDRERIRHGEFGVLVNTIREAFLAAGKIRSEGDFVPLLQVMRYRAFVKRLLDGMDTLKESHADGDVDWVQRELLKQMERLVGLRQGEAEISRRLGRR